MKIFSFFDFRWYISLFLFFVFISYSYCEQVIEKSYFLNVFIDCKQCDESFLKKEITFVNYVRDRYESQVHILVTTQNTASGGIEYTLEFIGQKDFDGINDTLKLASDPLDTEDIRRNKLVQIIKAGLMRYIARTSTINNISMLYTGVQNSETTRDLWNSWVFTISFYVNFQGEKSIKRHFFSNSLSANKTTKDWKIELYSGVSYAEDKFKTSDETITSLSRSYRFLGSLIKSVNKHWSLGIDGGGETSTYSNIHLGLSIIPKVEYNIFPYSESTKRRLCLQYYLTYSSVKYNEETIYDKTSENLLKESLRIILELKEKWGTVSSSIFGSHYFHDFRKYSLGFSSSLSLNIGKGFSFNFISNFSQIHDQLSLKKGSASMEEILLRRSEIATQYSYSTFIGISYKFGSIYNNIVNPRFDGLSMSF
jgi:hypothetical protein